MLRFLPDSFRRWYESPEGRKMVRYAMVSVVAVPIGLVSVDIFLAFMTAGWAGLAGNSVAAVPSYYLNRTWVWGKGGRSHFVKEILPFWVITIIGVGLAGWTTKAADSYAHRHAITGLARVITIDGAVLAAFAGLWVLKYILFNRVLFVARHHAEEVHEF